MVSDEIAERLPFGRSNGQRAQPLAREVPGALMPEAPGAATSALHGGFDDLVVGSLRPEQLQLAQARHGVIHCRLPNPIRERWPSAYMPETRPSV
jgi:hypothetical protein